MEPSDEQYLVINALQTLELLERYLYEQDRGLWFIETPAQFYQEQLLSEMERFTL